jgi:hypothetical protein
MKTARLMFPLTLALTAGCATTLDKNPTVRSELGVVAAAPTDAAACIVSGAVHTIAPQALVRSGVELVSTNNGLALGFRTTPHDGVIMKIDPTSAMATQRVALHSVDPIRRVTPTGRDAETFGAAMDTDCKTNRLDGAVTVSAKEPFVIGTADGEMAWASCAAQAPHSLWQLPKGKVRDLRGVALSDGGYAVLFAQKNALWFGRLDAEKNPAGPLSKIAQGSHLRWPTIAQSGEHLLVVWAELMDGRDQWSLSAVSVAPCGHTTPIRLDLPLDTAEGDAIQPALAAVDANHFLLVWTAGTATGHDVRAVTLQAEGRAVGPVLKVSSGAESGWGQPAVTADGRGAVVYFVPTDSGFAIAATPIACPLASPPSAPIVSTRL